MKVVDFGNGFSCAMPDSNRTVFVNIDNKNGKNLHISNCEYRPTPQGFSDIKEITTEELFAILRERDKHLNDKL